MKIIVFGLTTERAYEKLDAIVSKIHINLIANTKRGSNEYYVLLNNGVTLFAMGAFLRVRGHKYDLALIDDEVDKDTLHNIVIPMSNVSFLPEEARCVYWNYRRLLSDNNDIGGII